MDPSSEDLEGHGEEDMPSLAIKKFSVLDSSSDEDEDEDIAASDTVGASTKLDDSGEVQRGAQIYSEAAAAVKHGAALDTTLDISFELGDVPEPGRQQDEEPLASSIQPESLDASTMAADEAAASPTLDPTAHSSTSPIHDLTPRWKKKKANQSQPSRTQTGPDIYERGLKAKRLADERLLDMKDNLLLQETKEATFHPKISRRAQSLPRKRSDLFSDANSERIKKRTLLLELPSTSVTPTRQRTRSATFIPPGERLYRDHFYRQQAAQLRETRERQRSDSSPTVRTWSEIDQHVNSLHRFGTQRLENIEYIRAHQDSGAMSSSDHRALVNPRDVVDRLTRRKTIGALAEAEREQFSFGPTLSPSVDAHLSSGRQRGYSRWVDFFAGNGDNNTLCKERLHSYQGACATAAHCLAKAMSTYNDNKDRWSLEDICDMMENLEKRGWPQLWRVRPEHSADGSTDEALFAPKLNALSVAIVERQKKDAPALSQTPTTERLFISAKRQQLQERQRALELQQAALVEEASRREQHERAIKKWRQARRSQSECSTKDRNVENNNTTEATDQQNASLAEEQRAPPVRRVKSQKKKEIENTRRLQSSPPLVVTTEKPAPAKMVTSHNKSTDCASAPPEAVRQAMATLQELLRGTGVAPATTAACPLKQRQELTPEDIHSAAPASAPPALVTPIQKEAPTTSTPSSLLLACTGCRDPSTVNAVDRELVEKENRRRMRALGDKLYRRAIGSNVSTRPKNSL